MIEHLKHTYRGSAGVIMAIVKEFLNKCLKIVSILYGEYQTVGRQGLQGRGYTFFMLAAIVAAFAAKKNKSVNLSAIPFHFSKTDFTWSGEKLNSKIKQVQQERLMV